MINGTSSAIAPGQGNAALLDRWHIALNPGILMAPDDNAWVVFPEQQNMVLAKIVVAIEPVFQCQVGVDIPGLGYEDRLLDILFRYLLHRTVGSVSQNN